VITQRGQERRYSRAGFGHRPSLRIAAELPGTIVLDGRFTAALGKDWADLFAAIVAGDEVPRKKPAPDVHIEALSRLELSASECLAI
jgi:Haloacid dehalogenase-like hydrolase